jgi:TPR repeat protein
MGLFTWVNQKALEAKLKNGDINAAYELAHFHLQNSSRIGIEYLLKAANGNMVKAQQELAEYYLQGMHVPKDKKTAMYWLLRAADNDSSDAWDNLQKITLKMADKDAYDWYKMSSSQESKHAYVMLGNYHCSGIERYITVDYKAASEFYLKAFNTGVCANDMPLKYISKIGFYFYEKEKNYSKAFYWCKLAADLGDPQSEYYLARCYFNGTGVKKNCNLAVKYFESSMKKGISDSKLYLGQCYMQGIGGLSKNPEKALGLFKDIEVSHPEVFSHIGSYYLENNNMKNAAIVFEKANSAGVATEINEAFYKLALYYDKVQNYEKAVYWLNLSSKRNSDDGNFLMAQYLFYGKHYKKNQQEAIERLQKLANKGHSPSLLKIYEIYDKGEGVISPDKSKAFNLLKKLAESGNAAAMKNMGDAYMQRDNKLVQQDYQIASGWYDKWFKNPQKKVSINPDYLYEIGEYYYKNKQFKVANKWFLKASEGGRSDAYVKLGLIAEKSGDSNDDIIFKYFSAAAKADISAGMAYLAGCYYSGKGTKVNYPLAYKYFTMAAERDEALGLYGQAFCILNSVGLKPTDKDTAQAFNLLSRAAGKGNKNACELLADCYELGTGTEASLDQAIYYHFLCLSDKSLINMIGSKDYVGAYEHIKDKKEFLYYKMILTHFGKGTVIDRDSVCEMFVNCFKTESLKDISGKNATRPVFKYRIAEDVIKAGIGFEREGNIDKAITYYKAAIRFNPKAGILLARALYDKGECDSLPLLKIISEWEEKDRLYKKSKSIANYMLGLYYEYFYSKVTKPQTQYSSGYKFETTSVQKMGLMKQYYMNSAEDEAYKRIL